MTWSIFSDHYRLFPTHWLQLWARKKMDSAKTQRRQFRFLHLSAQRSDLGRSLPRLFQATTYLGPTHKRLSLPESSKPKSILQKNIFQSMVLINIWQNGVLNECQIKSHKLLGQQQAQYPWQALTLPNLQSSFQTPSSLAKGIIYLLESFIFQNSSYLK